MDPLASGQTSSQSVLQQHGWMLLSMLDSMGDGLVVTNADGRFVFFNEVAKRHFSFVPSDAKAAEWMNLAPCYRSDGVTLFPVAERPLTRALQGEAMDGVELLVPQARALGKRWLSVTARPL